MQVEFERLVQLANPEFVINNKIDSDTIFYFLNAYQERYLKENYVSLDSTKNSTETLHKNLDAFKALIVTTTLRNGYSLPDYSYATRFQLPNNDSNRFFLYLRSESNVTGTYMNFSGTTTQYNIDVNSAVQLAALTVSGVTFTYADFNTVLPGYIIPSVYNSVTEGPMYDATNKRITFFYQGKMYYKWEANASFKQYTAYVNIDTTKDNTDLTTVNKTIAGQIYKYKASSTNYYYDSDLNPITVTSSVSNKLVKVPNKLITQDDVEKILVSYYNQPILRQPCAVLDADSAKNNYITLYTDTYTNVQDCTITYIRKPRRFNVINPNNDASIVDQCELAENVHQEIVEGAVNMFITEGAYRLQVKQDNNNQQQNNNQ